MQEFELIIKLRKDGSVNVTGPIQNKVLCYGAMEAAKEAIHDWHVAQAAGPRIEVAQGELSKPG